MTLYNVLLFRGIPILYTYAYDGDEDLVGMIVTVPLGQTVCSGLVVSQAEPSASPSVRSIHTIEKTYCRIDKSLLSLMPWFALYYQCTPYKAFQTFGVLNKNRDVALDTVLETSPSPYALNPEQEYALHSILSHPLCHEEFYLHGVTGSGKTEVYMRLVEQMIQLGKSSLILVPEIALTPQYVRAFTDRFGARVCIIHSGLTKAQRGKEWNKINTLPVTVVIGARSAVFSPSKNLGLIVVDEEHEPSYKQDTHPRYDVHSVVEKRAEIEDCFLVYGSATPRVETYKRFQTEHKPIFTMLSRISGHALPTVELIDMKEAYRNNEGGIISKALEAAILDRLSKKEKTMILINRRGFASYVVCQKCKTVHHCPQCNLSYTYHQDKSFRCHRCGIFKASTHTCSACGTNSLAFSGTGIQKIELELQRLFPDAKTLRLDKDTAKTSKDMEAILNQFKGDGDILVGTQLIAKGHHIESVTLVGVLGIDQTLNMPDFRSPERTFQLLTQVGGRAGRGKISGHVIIQTLQPEHYAIVHASTHDFFSFYHQELDYREALLYPPFRSLIHIILSSKSSTQLVAFCKSIEAHVKSHLEPLEDTCHWLGPVPSPIEFVRNHYRHSVIIKHDFDSTDAVRQMLLRLPKSKDVRVIVDFDPYSLL